MEVNISLDQYVLRAFKKDKNKRQDQVGLKLRCDWKEKSMVETGGACFFTRFPPGVARRAAAALQGARSGLTTSSKRASLELQTVLLCDKK